MSDRDLFNDQRAGGKQAPRDELDLYDMAVEGPQDDPFLAENRLGLGNYEEREMWQQVESFSDGIFADAAFGSLLREWAVEQTKRAMALEAWDGLEDEEREEEWNGDRRAFVEARKDELWADLEPDRDAGDRQARKELEAERKAEAIDQHCPGVANWTPPHLRMTLFRHEVSRSRGARLMDNLFGRVREVFKSGDGSDEGINLRDAR